MTNSPTLTCRTEGRRDKVRAAGLNGIDYVEVVGTDQRDLRVYFLGKVPHGIHKANVLIEGGRRIRDIRVTHAEPRPAEEEDRDDSLLVTVDRAGDFSTYTLRIVEAHDGKPTGKPYHQFDPRYSRAEFSFKAGCPSDLDCTAEPDYPPPTRQQPDINYLAKDYASFRQLILDRLALIMPDWQERHVPDIGITLVELLAYVGDYLSYYQDAVGTEAYLGTARRRISVRRHARLVDYTLHEGCNARAWVCLDVSEDTKLPKDAFFAAGLGGGQITIDEWQKLPPGAGEVFEPLEPGFGTEIPLFKENSRMAFYTWGDDLCCLPRGATTATLLGDLADSSAAGKNEPGKLHLHAGSVVIFEEVLGPRTGVAANADPSKRWAVRLTKVKRGRDELCDLAVVEIEWSREDALPFPFCLSARLPAPDCCFISGISVARGNVLLVDHGRTTDGLDPTQAGYDDVVGECACEGSVIERTRVPATFAPTLKETPLTFSVPLAHCAPASSVLAQDPRQALPQIVKLNGLPDVWREGERAAKPEVLPGANPKDGRWQWNARPDLLASVPGDQHFVVEIDDEGRAHLRFGDGDSGRKPDAGLIFSARYRVGNGPAGNVGAGTISTVVTSSPDTGIISAGNPLPAVGGTAPEPAAEAKLFAPGAFRKEIQRAIIADDYARLAERHAKIQRAGAVLRWTGSWYEAQVAIDPFDSEEPEAKLLDSIRRWLHRYRRIGHDVVVQRARYVPLQLTLDVCVKPHFLRAHVEAALLDLFGNRRLPDGKLGFFHPDRLTFGTSIYLSQIVAAAQAVEGVDRVTVSELQRLGEPANDEIANGVLPIGPLEIAQLENDRNFPDHGKLKLNLGGGR